MSFLFDVKQFLYILVIDIAKDFNDSWYFSSYMRVEYEGQEAAWILMLVINRKRTYFSDPLLNSWGSI